MGLVYVILLGWGWVRWDVAARDLFSEFHDFLYKGLGI
jgi:hypothetical protein